ncbi:MAG: NAD(P)H-dependent oxidoreductase [Phycisphaerae bacterium]|nr:NAD(P)H-dependent oxidoreductase [Phycisphaerae bacterium]
MANVRVLVIAGSARSESWNRRLASAAAAAIRAAGGEATELAPVDLPLYNGDLEARGGLPPAAVALKAAFREHHALFVASPEHNSSVSAYLKNLIDWASRSAPGEGSLAAFAGKTAAIASASTGALGGLRGLVHLRAILGNIGVLVLPEQLAVSAAQNAFNPDGSLKDKAHADRLATIAARLVKVAGALA